MANGAKLFVVIFAVVTITSCSHPKRLSTEELRSTLTQAVSFASESETFIDYVVQKRATKSYARGHLQYLLDELSRSAKETHESIAALSTQEILAESQDQLDHLVAAVRYASREQDDPEKLRVAKQQIANTRRALEKAKDSL
ncbi:MAG TPA: hypothetical protein VN577_09315 [Terriglobales bacterium]|nr:hypothetical protein [Terriglobales bacterium]